MKQHVIYITAVIEFHEEFESNEEAWESANVLAATKVKNMHCREWKQTIAGEKMQITAFMYGAAGEKLSSKYLSNAKINERIRQWIARTAEA